MTTEPMKDEIAAFVRGEHADPHRLLGPHREGDAYVVRAFRPLAQSVTLLCDAERTPMTHLDEGVWSVVLDRPVEDYRLEAAWDDGVSEIADDPWRFPPTLGELDLHLIGEGRHECLWEVLGVHARTVSRTTGMSFTLWAPHARAIRVVGDFNAWDGRAYPMRRLGSSGIWELFVPDLSPGFAYKFSVFGADGVWREKADPMAQRTELPPLTASVAYDATHRWADEAWMSARTDRPDLAAMSVYEVHAGSWRRHPDGSPYSYDELAEHLTAYVLEMGYTYVELLPVMEHPFGGSWGYQVTSYYAPSARHGDPDGLRRLIDALHSAGIGVILDWVPAHFPKDEFALARFDGTPLYEHPDPQRGEHPDWGTYIFDFGRPEVRNFLVANALYWLEEFHVDGLRVDAVASMLYLDYSREEGGWQPNAHGGRENLEAVQFLQELNATVYRRVPGAFTVAEESTSWPGVTRATDQGGLGFGFKWNMGWMHDTLHYLERDPLYRGHHHGDLTFTLVYGFSENYVLPLSHDEVVHGKGSLLDRMPGDRWNRFAHLRSLYALQYGHPGKKLLFMGGEFGQAAEWAEPRELDWWLLAEKEHDGVRRLVIDLNTAYRALPALWDGDADPARFRWLDTGDGGYDVLAFLRRAADGTPMVVVANVSGVPVNGYRLGLPRAGRWREVLNTDAEVYGGSGVGNLGVVEAEPQPWQDQPASVEIVVPPAGVLWLHPEPTG